MMSIAALRFDDAKATANLMVTEEGWTPFYPQELPFAMAPYPGVDG